MRIAVTGGAGFIGKALLKTLADEGHEVRALENRTPVVKHKNITPVKGSLQDVAALNRLIEQCDTVIHGAGLVATLQNKQFYKVNTEGTRRLAQIAAYGGCSRFLLVSSLSAREGGLSHYGNSKKRAEEVLHAMPDFGWDVIRPPAVYGPEDSQFLALLKMIKKGRVYLPAGREARASLIYVDDLVAAIKAWVDAGTAHQKIYEIHDGTEKGYLWQEVVDCAADALYTKPRVMVPPRFTVRTLSYASWLSGALTRKTPLLPPEKMRQLCHPDWVVKNTDFNTDFNWHARITAKEGFARTIKWYQQQKLL